MHCEVMRGEPKEGSVVRGEKSGPLRRTQDARCCNEHTQREEQPIAGEKRRTDAKRAGYSCLRELMKSPECVTTISRDEANERGSWSTDGESGRRPPRS
jgi:hypothetical protein